MDVSFVIVSYNAGEFLRRCLASVYKHTQSVSFEVIIIDNGSRDGTPEIVEREFPQVTLVRRSSNAGFATAANEGLQAARGDALVLLNPDSELTCDIVQPMLAYLRDHPDIGILAPRIVNEDGSLQLSCRTFPAFNVALFNRHSLATKLLPGNRFSSRYLMTDFDHSGIADVDWASGACWLLPRRTLEQVGLLDGGYFWSIEDVDYCQRVHRLGLRIVYYPEVTVLHHIGRSSATIPNKSIIARHRGMWRYYRQHLRPHRPVVGALVDGVVGAGIAARCGANLAVNNVKRRLGRDGA
ncbi:MAG: glycosyltransferase family 2 protein [Dehalococcoidia bacterium]